MDLDKIRTWAAFRLIDVAVIADEQGSEQHARNLMRLARTVRRSVAGLDELGRS